MSTHRQKEDKYLVQSDFRDRQRSEGTLKTNDNLRSGTSSTVDDEDAAVAVSVCVRSSGPR